MTWLIDFDKGIIYKSMADCNEITREFVNSGTRNSEAVIFLDDRQERIDI